MPLHLSVGLHVFPVFRYIFVCKLTGGLVDETNGFDSLFEFVVLVKLKNRTEPALDIADSNAWSRLLACVIATKVLLCSAWLPPKILI